MGKGRKAAVAAVAAALVAAVAAPSTALAGYLGYQDVDEGHWGAQSGVIEYASGRGLLTGYAGANEGNWGPDDQVTRGQMAVIMYRICLPEDEFDLGQLSDNDVRPFKNFNGQVTGRFYEDQMNWAYLEGLVTGNGCIVTGDHPNRGWSRGEFISESYETFNKALRNYLEPCVRGDDPVTREELAVMLARLAEHRGDYDASTVDLAALDAAPDGASVSEWAREGVAWAVGNGLMGGAPGGWLDPQGTATRAEAAKMLMTYMKGAGFDLSEHERVWVDGRIYTGLSTYNCTACGAKAYTKEGIEHRDGCPALTGGTVWISLNFPDGDEWFCLGDLEGEVYDKVKTMIDNYGMLEGWYDWV